jgi:hypothetical protein
MFRSFSLTTAILATATLSPAQGPRKAIRLDPISAIVDAFKTHPIVGLSEGDHNNEQGYAFRLALIRDPRFAMAVNDIVVESGSSKYQDVMDRFVQGESVPDAMLRRAWQDTTAPDAIWDVPMYEGFFRAVREVNQSLPRERRMRVLLGDPPFDWEKATRDEWLRVDRDGFAADLVRREVLAKQRHALLIYGNTHLLRHGSTLLVPRLLSGCETCIFSIWTHTSGGDLPSLQEDIATWQAPAMALTKDTVLGAAPLEFYRPTGEKGPRMDEQFDAILYLGPVSSITRRPGEVAPSLWADADYMRMRLKRMALVDPPGRTLPPGIQSPADRLRNYCATVTTRDEGGKQ